MNVVALRAGSRKLECNTGNGQMVVRLQVLRLERIQVLAVDLGAVGGIQILSQELAVCQAQAQMAARYGRVQQLDMAKCGRPADDKALRGRKQGLGKRNRYAIRGDEACPIAPGSWLRWSSVLLHGENPGR